MERDKNGTFSRKYDESFIGKKFNCLTVNSVKYNPKGAVIFTVVCDCGNVCETAAYRIVNGHCKSCGCKVRENQRKAATKHNMSNSRLYRIWVGMKNRCCREDDPHYSGYGGRGISICADWLDSKKFFDWALRYGYDDALSIERIDNNGNYEPSNCRWATVFEQANNRRTNKRYAYSGRTLTLAEWSSETGILRHNLTNRIKRGWSIERALTTPVKA
jgi:hypothetical protein